MSEKIEEIRARHERDDCLRDGLYPGAHRDRAFLLSEVDRLSLALQTIRDQGGDVAERWSSEVARRALEDKQ